MSELEEISFLQDMLIEFVRAALTALKPVIAENNGDSVAIDKSRVSQTFQFTSLGVVGIDLVVDEAHRPYILEFNNNPAMPPPNKCMSENYRHHLVNFIRATVSLGLGNLNDSVDFLQV